MKSILLFLAFIPCFLFAAQIVVIGDSITSNYHLKDEELYFSILKENLNTSYEIEIIHCGVEGMSSKGGIRILSCLYDNFYPHAFKPDIAILAIGFNDLGLGLKPEDTQQNIELFIQKSLEHGCIPIVGRLDLSYVYPRAKLEKIKNINKVFQDLETKTLMFDFLTPYLMNDPSNHVGDKIHPNAKGHRIIAHNLEKVILPLLKANK